MKIIETSRFQKALRVIDKAAQTDYQHQKTIFNNNWRDSRLHVKKLVDLDGVYSFRVSRRYRVLFYFQDNQIVVFFIIGHRKDIYR